MSLKDPIGFARSTLSLGANPLLQAQDLLDRLRGKREWQIEEASYNGIRFHVFKDADFSAGLTKVEDMGGRRKAIYKFPYVDGQTTDDLGREGSSFTFEAIIHGPNYKFNWLTLEKELNKPTPGDLVHPIRGTIRVVPKSFRSTHEASTRQAVLLQLEFIEHNFTIGSPKLVKVDTTFQGAISRAVAAVKKIEDFINVVNATTNVAQSFKNQLRQDLDEVKRSYKKKLTNINTTFGDGSDDLPGAVPVNGGGNTNPDGSEAGDGFTSGTSPNDPFTTSDDTGIILTTKQAVEQSNAYRNEVEDIIELVESEELELQFFDSLNDMRATAIALQEAVETGVSSSKPKILEYTLPREMSIREVAFANGLNPDQMVEIDLLNPTLESVNVIAKGSVLQIPVSL